MRDTRGVFLKAIYYPVCEVSSPTWCVFVNSCARANQLSFHNEPEHQFVAHISIRNTVLEGTVCTPSRFTQFAVNCQHQTRHPQTTPRTFNNNPLRDRAHIGMSKVR